MDNKQMIIIDQPITCKDGQDWLVSTKVRINERIFELWFRSNSGPLSDGIESFVAACLVPAMKLGYAIQSPGPISAHWLTGLTAYQHTIQQFFPELRIIPVLGETKQSNQPRAKGVGSFFSCGVDACYTFLKHHDEITAGILIHGFDYLQNKALAKNAASSLAQQATAKLNRPLIEVETNIRSLGDEYVPFDTHYHGSVLASVALLLSPQLGTVYIPSSYHYDDLFPWASHPELDPLWSTEATQIHHDGCDVTRSQKVDCVAQNDAALSVLRVCFKEYTTSGAAYNCGMCEKCVRTMVDLRIAGALERCPTFRRSLRLKSIARIDLRHAKKNVSFYKGSLKQAKHKGNDPALEQALEECLSGIHYRGIEGFFHDARKFAYRDVLRPMIRPIERTVRKISRKINPAANSTTNQ
ncbi:MAG TPA: hypothetical protein PLN21_12815 [Gemmatales bacterium]|nr:hypothetical protein [Gemmatales bacterium]